jgi:hypothetical protein
MFTKLVVLGGAVLVGAAVGIMAYREHTEVIEAKVGPTMDTVINKSQSLYRLARVKVSSFRNN